MSVEMHIDTPADTPKIHMVAQDGRHRHKGTYQQAHSLLAPPTDFTSDTQVC